MKLDSEEQEIVEYIETSNPKSSPNLKKRVSELKQIITHNTTKKKQINIRILEADLEKLKSRALQEGVPYQTLINSVVHKYVNGIL